MKNRVKVNTEVYTTGSLAPVEYLQSQWIDFKNLNGSLEAEKILHNLYTIEITILYSL